MKSSADQNGAAEQNTYIYEPYKKGLPELKPYFREMWRRRDFAFEMASADSKSQHGDSLLGRAWMVLTPMLLALVYYVLVFIIREKATGPEFLVHLIAGVFLIHFISGSMNKGAQSVTGGGKLVTNRSFPKLLLPLTATITKFKEFLPTIFILFLIFAVSGLDFHVSQLLIFPLTFLAFLTAFGLSAVLATAQVYLRDTKNLIPFAGRFLLYSSPVLYLPEHVPSSMTAITVLNPVFGLVSAWSEAVVMGRFPTAMMWATSTFWAFGLFLIGTYVFLSREREFSVRI